MKKILIFTYMDISKDPRAHRQVKWLKDGNEVHCICEVPTKSDDINFIEYKNEANLKRYLRFILLKLRCYKKYTWNKPHLELVSKLSKQKYDLIIVHHIKLLPVAFKISKDSKIILDAHEYYTKIYNDSFMWRLFMNGYYRWLTETYIPKCDLVITVNESIKNFYQQDFHVLTSFINNAVDYDDLTPHKTDNNKIRIIHHGQASRSRKIELMIELMRHLDKRYTLTLIIVPHGLIGNMYLKKLRKLARGLTNIFFADPLPFSEITRFCNEYDIGLFFMPPSNLNEEYSLGNKVFQYIQSRLALAFSPLPEMKKIVDDYDLGVCSDDYDPRSLAKKINDLDSSKIDYYKRQSNKFAKQLSSEANKDKFLTLIHQVLSQ